MIVFKGSAFYFLRLLIQFIIRGNNTFGMGVWYGSVLCERLGIRIVIFGLLIVNHGFRFR